MIDIQSERISNRILSAGSDSFDDLPEPPDHWLIRPPALDGSDLPTWLTMPIPSEPANMKPLPAPKPVAATPLPPARLPVSSVVQVQPLPAVAPDTSRPPTIRRMPLVYGLVAKVDLPRPAFAFRVEHDLPSNVVLLETNPKATVVGDHLIWTIPRVDPGKEIRLQVVVLPEDGVTLSPSDLTSFSATYQQNLFFQVPLVRARLGMVITGPATAKVGEEVELALEITNTGNWPVTGIALMPATVTAPEPLRSVDLGTLQPTERRQATIRARVKQAGPQKFKVRATGTPGISVEAEVIVQGTPA